MSNETRINRRGALGLLVTPLMAGCLPIPSIDSGGKAASGPADDATANNVSADDGNQPVDLQSALDRVLGDGHRRELDVTLNGAWQVLHGVLAYGTDCVAQTPAGPQKVVDYLMSGGKLAGFDPLSGDMLTPGEMLELGDKLVAGTESSKAARRGVRFELEPGSLTGQGHRDQWLAVLYQSGLEPDAALRIGETLHSMDDAVRQAAWDIPRNLEREYSWTLIGLTGYRGTDFSWKARDGNRWSIEQLVESETAGTLELAACGGTHRLIGLAMALNFHAAEGKQTRGLWSAADERVQRAIADSREYQNGDGSFSTTYLHRYGWSPDLSDVLRTTGHVLEFLSLAGTKSLLSERWVESAAWRLCDVLLRTTPLDLECGALYHALHGVLLYRNKRFPDKPWTPVTA